MKLATLQAGQFVETGGYYAKGDAGQARYLIKAAQAFDGYADHELVNGTIAVLQVGYSLDIRQVGAVIDGANNDTEAVKAAVATQAKVLTHGYGQSLIKHSEIVLGNYQEFTGRGEFINDELPNELGGTPDFLLIRCTQNNKVTDLTFTGLNNRVYATGCWSSLSAGRGKNITVKNITANLCGIFISEPDKGFTLNKINETFTSWVSSGPVLDTDISEDITVSDCVMYGDPIYNAQTGDPDTSQVAGVTFWFTRRASSINNNVRYSRFGSWAYGGTVVASDNVSVADTPLLCDEIQFIGGTARDVHSTFWMSRASNSSITGTTSLGYKDVVLDFEGCAGITCVGNTVIDTDGGGGAMVCLWGNSEVLFSANIFRIAAGVSGLGPQCINSNSDIVYDGNIISNFGTNDSALVVQEIVGTTSPRSDNITIINNKFDAVRVQFESGSNVTVNNNKFKNTPGSNTIKFFQTTDTECKGNTIKVVGALAGSSNSPIQLVHSAALFLTGTMLFEGNRILGHTGNSGISVFVANEGANLIEMVNNKANGLHVPNAFITDIANNYRGQLLIQNNYANAITDSEHIAGSELRNTGGTQYSNRSESYANSPAGLTGTYRQGDIVWKALPTAGTTLGWVIVTGGTGGSHTFKDMPSLVV